MEKLVIGKYSVVGASLMVIAGLAFPSSADEADEKPISAFARKVSKRPSAGDAKGATPPGPDAPGVSGALEVSVENDFFYKTTPKANRLNDLYTKTEASLGMHFNGELSLQTALKYEPIRAANVHSRAFEDQALWVDRLFANYQGKENAVYIGKYHPTFSIGYDRAPGFFGNDFAEDYELKEKVGLGVGRKFDAGEAGEHEILFEVFQSDRWLTSRSFFNHAKRGDNNATRIWQGHERDGGLANDGNFDSYVVALNGDGGKVLPNFAYHLAYRRLAPGIGQSTAEHGVVGALQYGHEIASETWFKPMVEYAKLRHTLAPITQQSFERDATYLTTGFELSHKEWFWAASRTGRNFDARDNNRNGETHDRLVATSVGYRFDVGVTTELGWKDERTSGANGKALGARIGYSKEF